MKNFIHLLKNIVYMNKKIACIWARDTPEDVLQIMEELWSLLVLNDFEIASWNAVWADEYFAKGWNKVDSSKVTLYVPWYNLNKHLVVEWNKVIDYNSIITNDKREEIDWYLSQVHRNWSKVKDYVRLLHRRNYWIIENSLCVICYTVDWTDRGGTWIWIRLAKLFWIPVFNLFYESEKDSFLQYINNLKNKCL